MKKFLLIAAMALGASAVGVMAEDAKKQERGPRPDGPRPRMPLIAALDANADGVIDADEINNASAALKKLDKNGDGKLTREELMPPRPEGAPERGEGKRAPRDGQKKKE